MEFSSEFRCEATRILSSIRKSSTFLTIKDYQNNFGEISNFSIAFHIDYKNAVKRSKLILEKYFPEKQETINRPYSLEDLLIAQKELLYSFELTLNDKNTYTNKYSYSTIVLDKNEGMIPISGIKLHLKQNIIHLYGFRIQKRVLVPGQYPEDHRFPKTIAKNDLKHRLPVGRFGQFKLTPGRFSKISVENFTIEELDVVEDFLKNISKIEY